MQKKVKPSDPGLYQVTLVPKLDASQEGLLRYRATQALVAEIILLGMQRGRPRKDASNPQGENSV